MINIRSNCGNPYLVDLFELQYWRLWNTLYYNIHCLATKEKLRFVNLDQVQLKMDKSRRYEPSTYYFDKFNKICFTVVPEFLTDKRKPSVLAIDYMEQKLGPIRKFS